MANNVKLVNIINIANSGILKNVEYVFEIFYEKNKLLENRDLKSIFLEFQDNTIFTINIFDDDDSIELYKGRYTRKLYSFEDSEYKVVPTTDIWEGAINTGLIWVWELKNQQGYNDGLQFEFKKIIIQIMCIASSLKVFTVNKTN